MSNDDPWEPWLSGLEAGAAGDDTRARSVLRNLWQFNFHEQNNARHDRWDRMFEAVCRLVLAKDADIHDSAFHYLWVVLQAEYGPPYKEHTRETRQQCLSRRTGKLLPVFSSLIKREPHFLLGCTDNLCFSEELADM